MIDRREAMRAVAALGFGMVGLAGTARAAVAAAKLQLSDAEWKRKLSPRAYAVLRQQATEAPFSSPLNSEHRPGIFACAGCDQRAFSSRTKFESGTGCMAALDAERFLAGQEFEALQAAE